MDISWRDIDGVVRLIFQNVQGFGFDKRVRKYTLIYKFINNCSAYLIGMAKGNTYWPKVQMDSRIFELTKEWFKARHVNVGYNLQDKDAPRSQQGGAAAMTMDRLAYKVSGSGGDLRKLGR